MPKVETASEVTSSIMYKCYSSLKARVHAVKRQSQYRGGARLIMDVRCAGFIGSNVDPIIWVELGEIILQMLWSNGRKANMS